MREADHCLTEEDAAKHQKRMKRELWDHEQHCQVPSDPSASRRPTMPKDRVPLDRSMPGSGDGAWNSRECKCTETGSRFTVTTASKPPPRSSWTGFTREEMSKELLDIASTLTFAARLKADGFVWLCYNHKYHWNHKKKSNMRSTTPNAGAFMAAVTANAARFLISEGVHTWTDCHTGTLYRRILEKFQHNQDMTGGYVFPPIGHYYQHVSSTWSLKASGAGELPSHWGKHNVVSGASGAGCDGGGRWVAKITKKGEPEWLNNTPYDAAPDRYKLFWRTQAPPECPAVSLGVHPHHWGSQDRHHISGWRTLAVGSQCGPGHALGVLGFH